MTTPSYDVAVIGAGIVGLAGARALQRLRPELRLIVLEKEPAIGSHQTGHNSGVVHSGIYYRPGSLKASLCVQGNRALRFFCEEQGIPIQRCGKVIVATEERELPLLQELHRRGTANGVPDLKLIGPGELKEVEPAARCLQALHVPSASMVDYTKVVDALAKIIRSQEGEIRTSCRVKRAKQHAGGFRLETSQGEILSTLIINCAGLYSDRIAGSRRDPAQARIIPFRGEYYLLAEERGETIRGLIYPVPNPRFPFLGIHLTRRMNGKVEVGPNAVLALAREGYRKMDFNLRDCWEMVTYRGFWKMSVKYWKTGFEETARSMSKRLFLRSLQQLVPSIELKDLLPAPSGVRAQGVEPTGALLDDFRMVTAPGEVHVLNAPSPAATSCLTIADRIAESALASLGRRAGSPG